MFRVVSCVLLLAVLAHSIDVEGGKEFLRRISLEPRIKMPECTAPGPTCSTCNAIADCVVNPSTGGLDMRDTGLCDASDITCRNAQCVTGANLPCTSIAEIEFYCYTRGVFPNPGDCKRYVICLPDSQSLSGYTAMPISCPPGKGYHAGDGYCSKTLTNNQCPKQPITCPPTQEITYQFLEENLNIMVMCYIHPLNFNLRYPTQIDLRYVDQ